MLRVVDCLTLEHDLDLVLLAAAICVLGAWSIVTVAERVLLPPRRVGWLLALSLCAGTAVWSTHFVAMLAWRSSLPITYDPTLTALSFVVGVVVMGAGFAIATHDRRRPWLRALGGNVLGIGVALLHYIGMSGLRFPGQLSYAADLVVLSLLLSISLGALATHLVFRPRATGRALPGTLALIAMVVTLHFTGMGAVQLVLAPQADVSNAGFTRTTLVEVVTVASIVTFLIGLASARVDRRLSARLLADAQRFRTLAEGAFEGLLVHHQGRLVDANSTAMDMLGLASTGAESRLKHMLERLDELVEIEQQDPADSHQIDLVDTRGARLPVEVRRRQIALPDGRTGELLAVRDLTARRQSEARIAHLALHDALTDLPNRHFLVELTNNAMAHARRSEGPFALLVVNLDDFKRVNELHGHSNGDELLKTVAGRLRAQLLETDVLARIGGDEFVILQSSSSQPKQAINLSERLIETIREPVRFGSHEIAVSGSIGIAIHPQDGRAFDELLRNADTALQRAKADGPSTFRFFEEQMDEALQTRRRIESKLRTAIQNQALTVAYQPLVDCVSQRVLGCEALVRWHDPELGHVSPAQFIPVAEESDLIVPLGEFVLRRACADASTWPGHCKVAVNLSAVQFRRKGLTNAVRKTLTESGLPGQRLELEITENLLIENREQALQVLRELKSMGVTIAMDDFGTGFSSLSYLKSFPFDKIKIDRSFVSDLDHNAENASIVRAVTSMGKSLRMRVVAEGVETQAQAITLRELECDELQGYLIARPMGPSQIHEFLSLAHPDDATTTRHEHRASA
ncbi:MAG: EAL domain-containing protein [Gammaproteobacteria bacterium]|nr:EAL domain-containing protein [Gammaproteobacteria bacterium]